MKSLFKSKMEKCVVVIALILLSSTGLAGSVWAADLTDQEKYWLTFMREEEKLARDVYRVLYEQWRIPVFNNIANSEQTHMNAIKALLDRYGIDDPASTEPGIFNNDQLQALYQTLVEQGSASASMALQVGETIENKDINDLNDAILSTQYRDIKKVYSNLQRASLNHLRAFVSNLALQGVIYEE